MAFEAYVHKKLRKEVPDADWSAVEAVLKEVAASDAPARHPKVGPLEGCSILNSHRVRIGRWRVTFAVFDEAKRVVFTVAFLERRKEDYKQAVRTHEGRVRDYQ